MDWDQRYRENDIPWEHGEPAPPLVEYLENNTISGRVLVPGCGFGHDARYLAHHGCDVLGVDVSSLALQNAQAFPKPSKGAVAYQLCDFLDPKNGIPREHFDLLFEHTCFCTLDPDRRADYAIAANRALKPDGQLLGIFFTHLEDPGNPPYQTAHEDVEAIFYPYFAIEAHWRPNHSYPGRENEESLYLMRRRS